MTHLPFNGIYNKKKVLVTGNTGFKGSWLTLWLSDLNASTFGYSLPPPTVPSLYEDIQLESKLVQLHGDVCDFEMLKQTIKKIQPDIIFHLAAQSLVGESYRLPLDTIRINTLGSVHVMEAVRQLRLPLAIVMVTTDKCYDNKEWIHGYRENDALGGYDPYSASKGAAEILISSYRNSFFNVQEINRHGVRLASVRAGNVIGGGDWAHDRIVPDCMRDLRKNGIISVRNPNATRPWQHVLEPLHGYLTLGAKLLELMDDKAGEFCEAFNFGPHVHSNRTVASLVEKIIQYRGSGMWRSITSENGHHEASLLNLSIDKSFHKLNWLPRWDFDTTVRHTTEWYTAWEHADSMLDFSLRQIQLYQLNTSNLQQEPSFENVTIVLK